MSVETKVLPASTRTNLETLKHHMKKLGFKYFEEKGKWICFGTRLYEGFEETRMSSSNHISMMLSHKRFFSMIDELDSYDKMPEAKQAILDFYEAEGITDED